MKTVLSLIYPKDEDSTFVHNYLQRNIPKDQNLSVNLKQRPVCHCNYITRQSLSATAA
jgi:hypothetical protein